MSAFTILILQIAMGHYVQKVSLIYILFVLFLTRSAVVLCNGDQDIDKDTTDTENDLETTERESTATESMDMENLISKKPNVIIIVADDAGWNDFSFHGSPQIPTPNLDALALSGVILKNYYASPLCTPTRGSLLTGKHPIHIRLQHYVITGGSEEGLPLSEKLLPEYLKKFGYSTHLVGKWHLGHSRKEYTPTYRGFDSHFGYWLGMQDYYDHISGDGGNFGYDFRSNMSVNFDVFGQYDTDLFTEEATRIIQNHAAWSSQETPLFLQINHIAPHSSNPYLTQQAPQENVDKFNETIENIQRRIYAGIVDKLDESVGLVVEALSTNQMLDNSIIIFTSDNGGAPEGFDNNYGSNYPLRGVKNTLWEGGIRVSGFIWSSLLINQFNQVSRNFMHVQDWLPTIIEAIGEDPVKLLPLDIDGISQWKAITGQVAQVRIELLHNIDHIYNNSAIRIGKWKLIQGNTTVGDLSCGKASWDYWYGPSGRSPNTSIHDLIPQIISSRTGITLSKDANIRYQFNINKMVEIQKESEVICIQPPPASAFTSCNPYNSPCLFDIESDPCEYINLADKHPAIVNSLLETIEAYDVTAKKPIPRYFDQASRPSKWNYVWTNWKDYL